MNEKLDEKIATAEEISKLNYLSGRREALKEVGLKYDEDGELINYPTEETWQALLESVI